MRNFVLSNFSTVFFYIGTFITSFGSLLFVMSVPAFFIAYGYSSVIIGIIIGIHRFSGIIATAVFGPKIDRFNSQRVIFITEFLAALSSVGLISSWIYREVFGLWLFGFFVGTRALTVGVQSSSRNRLIKLLSNESESREASFIIWLNKVTQGAHILSSLAAIPLLASGNLVLAIMIDGISFLIGGYSAVRLPRSLDAAEKNNISKINIIESMKNLIKVHRFVFLQDQLLALAVSGTILLMVKLSNGNSNYVIYFNIIFGSCIWLSSFFAHNSALRSRTISYWLILFLGYFLLTISFNSNWMFVSYFITYMGYWILYHKYTVEIQTKTHKAAIGATMAARGLAVAFTLSIGELLGGYITKLFDLKTELVLRTIICLLVLVFLGLHRYKQKKAHR